MQVIEIIITAASILSILFFLIYVVGLTRVPTGRRAKTPTVNRLGEQLPPSENPGYEETEGGSEED
jgi:hypothetical protein